MWDRAARAKFRGTLWLKLAVVGALNSAIPFMLFAWGAGAVLTVLMGVRILGL